MRKLSSKETQQVAQITNKAVNHNPLRRGVQLSCRDDYVNSARLIDATQNSTQNDAIPHNNVSSFPISAVRRAEQNMISIGPGSSRKPTTYCPALVACANVSTEPPMTILGLEPQISSAGRM